jgi:hypothetical protein
MSMTCFYGFLVSEEEIIGRDCNKVMQKEVEEKLFSLELSGE